MHQDSSNYQWTGVLEFLHSEYQKVALKDNIWFLEKKELTDQIKQLEGKLAASQTVNADLRHKNNMLEHCIRRIKLQQKGQKQPEAQPEIPIPQRRPKSNKPQIAKVLCSLGITNLLENISKDLKNKPPIQDLKIEIPKTSQQVKASNSEPNKYKQLAHLEEHQDGVRDLCFLRQQNYLASVSEDSTMKIWNIERPNDKVDCVATIREHAGPIFTAVEGQGYLFTGGMEGIVRCWDLPRRIVPGQAYKKLLAGSWNNSEDQKLQPIWQLLYYGDRKVMFSTSSQVAVRAFQLQFEQSSVVAKYKHSYIYQSRNTEEEDIPTAICTHQGSLYAGYVNNNFLVQFNLDSQKPLNTIHFQAEGQISTNRIASNNHIIAGAFEDAMIRIFDKSRLVHSFEAHQQAVMSISFTSNPYELFSCGQDGAVKLWDIRKYTEICSFKAHKSKYDEAGHCVSVGGNLVASGGADGVIKLYGCQN